MIISNSANMNKIKSDTRKRIISNIKNNRKGNTKLYKNINIDSYY